MAGKAEDRKGMAVCGMTRKDRTGRLGKNENKPKWGHKTQTKFRWNSERLCFLLILYIYIYLNTLNT